MQHIIKFAPAAGMPIWMNVGSQYSDLSFP